MKKIFIAQNKSYPLIVEYTIIMNCSFMVYSAYILPETEVRGSLRLITLSSLTSVSVSIIHGIDLDTMVLYNTYQ